MLLLHEATQTWFELQLAVPPLGGGQSLSVQQAVVATHSVRHFVYMLLHAMTHVFVDVSHVATPFDGCAQSAVVQHAVEGMQAEPQIL